MFETEIDEGGSFLVFAFQQVAVCIASVIWARTAEIPRALSSASGGNIIEALCIFVLAFVPAFFCGFVVQRSMPGFASSGRWVWLLPSFLLFAALLSSLPTFARNVSDLLYPPSQGEAWWAVFLFTYPWLGCLGYSLGIIFGARFEQKQTKQKTEEGV
jgi:hypothetical protein